MHQNAVVDMYRELHGNLSLWSVISTVLATARQDTLNEEVNINFYNVFIEFYKFYVTVK